MRIAVCGIATECSTFSPLLAGRADFRILTGDNLLKNGRLPNLEPDEEWLPILVARALPGGSVESDFFDELVAKIDRGLASVGPIDAVYLDLHGAMNVHGRDDAEGALAAAIRHRVGPDTIIGASMDLHGNITEELVQNIDVLTGYRTAPHVDVEETRECAMHLIRRCRAEGRPHKALVPIPVALPGEKTSTEWAPGDRLWNSLEEFDARPGIWDTSLFVGYAWADEPRNGAVSVVFGSDPEAAGKAAEEIAQLYFDARQEFQFGADAMEIDEAVSSALNFDRSPVILSDSGDNPTAGGAGDTTDVLRALLAAGAQNTLVAGLADEAAFLLCREGESVSLSLGGKLDPVHSSSLEVEARVLRTFEETAVLQIDGITLILTQRRRPFHHRSDFTDLGLGPEDYKVISVKIGYLVPELKAMAHHNILVLSPGAVDQRLQKRPYSRIKRPMFPWDLEFSWKPQAFIAKPLPAGT